LIEQSEIQFGRTMIPYGVRRSARRTTVALAVDGAGTLTVTAPPAVPLTRLDDVVRAKATWVLQRTKTASDRPPPMSSREWVTGETVRYLGRQYRLKIARDTLGHDTALQGGWLVVRTAEGDAEAVRSHVVAWLRQRAGVYLPARLEEVCERHGVHVPVLIVGGQQARWGSCDAGGTLRINWRIIQAPTALVDYVLLHELTHLEHASHNRAFWAALGRQMPDYERRRDRLRLLGPDLVW
jgi:predicted metal-dependent hydrolase